MKSYAQMTIAEAARTLGLSQWYVRQLCNKGEIAAFKEGPRWSIPAEVVAVFSRLRR
jgi:excisionase family DNA binding protein